MLEFTGERVIPGLVEADLWNEHVARYAFAARLAHKKRALDVGCGAGYGTAELATTGAHVIGADNSAEAIAHARQHYRLPAMNFVVADCTALPFADHSFDLVVAFEVIEHLEEWKALLAETRRLLAPDGRFLVSTPNKPQYAEARRNHGPNPYHQHEFEFGEFRDALLEFFPYTTLFVQNHSDAIAFLPGGPIETSAELRLDDARSSPEAAHFFVAVCALTQQADVPGFLYVPAGANALREREQHIRVLEQEVATKDAWLDEARREHQELLSLYHAQEAELERRTQWGNELDDKLKAARERIVAVQQELAREQAAAREVVSRYEIELETLREEVRKRTEWAMETEARLGHEVEERSADLAHSVELLHEAERTVEERTNWALQLQASTTVLESQLNLVRASRWVKLGRAFGIGPEIRT